MELSKVLSFRLQAKLTAEGEKPVARQAKVTVSPVPEPHGITGNTVGAVDVAERQTEKRYYQKLIKRNVLTTYKNDKSVDLEVKVSKKKDLTKHMCF